MAKLVLVHWDQDEAAAWKEELEADGWKVIAEWADPSLAYRRIRDGQADVVVVDLSQRSDDGVRLAESVRHSRWGREVPFVFVAGTDDDALMTLRDMVPEASFVERDELLAAVAPHRMPD